MIDVSINDVFRFHGGDDMWALVERFAPTSVLPGAWPHASRIPTAWDKPAQHAMHQLATSLARARAYQQTALGLLPLKRPGTLPLDLLARSSK